MEFGRFATLAAAGAVAFSALAGSQAQAASVGFGGVWEETGTGSAPVATTLSFDNLFTFVATGFFSGYDATLVKPLDLVLTSSQTVGDTVLSEYAIVGGYDGTAWKTYFDGSDEITFDLDLDATWVRTFDVNDGDLNYDQGPNGDGVFEYTGTYTLADGTTVAGRGQLNASSAGQASTFEITQTAVPVPAAVWLMGTAMGLLGAARIRRRPA